MKNIPLLSRAPRFSHMLLAVLASVVFGGCSPYQKAAPQPEPTVPLTGMVTYRERMALPPDAGLTVTLHRKTSDGRMLVAEERASTEGRNVPLPFSIACPAASPSSSRQETGRYPASSARPMTSGLSAINSPFAGSSRFSSCRSERRA